MIAQTFSNIELLLTIIHNHRGYEGINFENSLL